MKTIDRNMLAALVEKHARGELAENKISAKEIIVHQNGERIYHGLFGMSAKNRVLFRAASMTKPVTAAAVMQLVDLGQLDLKEPISRYYPAMEHMQVAAVENGKITSLRPAQNTMRVVDLLCHVSGVGSEPVLSALKETTSNMPLKEAVQIIAAQPLAFEPRTAQAYSPTAAFDLAAGIVEQVSGQSFGEYLHRNLFEPLGMVDTTFTPNTEQWARMAPMHNRNEQGQSEIADMPGDSVFADYCPERMAAGAGLATTAEDYNRFAEMLCHGGMAPNGVRVLSQAAVRIMATPHVPDRIAMGSERWGLGVRVIVDDRYPHGLGVGCFGWSGAYGTHFWVDPQNRVSVVMMKNSLYDGGAGNRSALELERDVTACLR